MDFLFPPDFEDCYFRSHAVWFDLSCRERNRSPSESDPLRERVFGSVPVRLSVSVFGQDPAEDLSAASERLIRERLEDPTGRSVALFTCPLPVEDGFTIALNLYLSRQLKTLMDLITEMERFHPAELFRQDKWRLNKALNLTGQVRLDGLPEERQETVRSILAESFGIPAVPVLQTVNREDILREIRQSLDHVWDAAVPKGRYDEALRIHKDLCALTSSAAGFWTRLLFFFYLQDHFISFFRRFSSGSGE
jgi:hypothetical protein